MTITEFVGLGIVGLAAGVIAKLPLRELMGEGAVELEAEEEEEGVVNDEEDVEPLLSL